MPIKRNFNRSTSTFEEVISKFNRADKTAKFKRRDHIEDDLQEICVKWFDLTRPTLRPLLHHSPNGGKRNVLEAKRFKRMGTRAGFADLVLLVPRNGYHGLFIEMKTPSKSSKQQDTQKEFQAAVETQGYKYTICRTLEEFTGEIEGYLE